MMAESFEVNINPFSWRGVIGRGRFIFSYILIYFLTSLLLFTSCRNFIKVLKSGVPPLEVALSGSAPVFESVVYVTMSLLLTYIITVLYAKRFNDIFAKSEKRGLIVTCYSLVMTTFFLRDNLMGTDIFTSLFLIIVFLVCSFTKGAVTSEEKGKNEGT